jgi:hypothetical protein
MGSRCEEEVNKKVAVCLFVFNDVYVSVSSPVVLCEHGWSKNNWVRFISICTVPPPPRHCQQIKLHTVYKLSYTLFKYKFLFYFVSKRYILEQRCIIVNRLGIQL